MKRAAIVALLLSWTTMLLADRIILRDSTEIRAKVIQVTKRGVEYNPGGDKAFDVIPRDQLMKIVYDDGREERFVFDRIRFYDGKVLEGNVVEVDQGSVMFTQKNTAEKTSIPRERIQSISFSDGREIFFQKDGSSATEQEQVQRVPGFHKSIVRIAGVFGFGAPVGAIMDREEDVFQAHLQYLVSTFGLRDYTTSHAFLNYGVDLDLLLPAFEFEQSSVFDFTGIKLGIRGRYIHTMTYSSIYDEHDYGYRYYDSDLFFGRLMTYDLWAVGPVCNFMFSPRSNNFNFMINCYVLYGQTFDATFTAVPTMRDAGVYYERLSYRTKFSAYSIRAGLGPHFVLNRWLPVTIGINATYSMMRMTLNHYLNAYGDVNTASYMHEWGAELSLGLHF
ncbi:MAG: hypothetical protein JXA20_15260 [Spirochaetes bacterium]|nr:hypothetical protein [Spirochaetota bacterium]